MAGALRTHYNSGSKTAHLIQVFLLRKTIKFHVLLVPHILLNCKKKILRVNPELCSQTIFGTKMTHLTKIVFFKKPFNEFSCTSWPLSLCKISTKSLKWIQSYDDVPFSYQNGTFAPNKTFFKKTINISSMYLLAPFIVQNLKNILGAYPKL